MRRELRVLREDVVSVVHERVKAWVVTLSAILAHHPDLTYTHGTLFITDSDSFQRFHLDVLLCHVIISWPEFVSFPRLAINGTRHRSFYL